LVIDMAWTNEEKKTIEELMRKAEFEDYTYLRTLWREAKSKLNRVENYDFKVGDEVRFGRPRGEQHDGKIVKLNPKKAHILVDFTTWRVPYSLIQLLTPNGE